MQITITLDSPDLEKFAEALIVLATELVVEIKNLKSTQSRESLGTTHQIPQSAQLATPVNRNIASTLPEPEPAHEQAPTVTLEQVRAKLAALTQQGKQSEVKALLTKFGAKKLTEIPAEKYAELMKEAEAI